MVDAPYEIRTGGDGKSKKQSMAKVKLCCLHRTEPALARRLLLPVSKWCSIYAYTVANAQFSLRCGHVAISEYDQLLFEDETVNRMQEALTLD